MADTRRILCLSRHDDRADYDTAQSLSLSLQDRSQRITYDACHLEELAFLYDGSELCIVNTRTGEDLRKYDGIFLLAWFKWRKHEEAALAVSLYAQAHGIKTLNSEALHNRSRGKLSQCVMAALNGISTTPFVMIIDHDKVSSLVAESTLVYPMIVKSITGSRGTQNYLVHDAAALDAALAQMPTKAVIVQTFVPNQGDYRLLVMGVSVRLVIHRRTQSDSHLNNTSQGGAATLVDPASLPAIMLADSLKMSKLLKREITGVDMIVDDKTGRHYFLEANNMPQLSTGSFTDAKAKALNEFFEDWAGV